MKRWFVVGLALTALAGAPSLAQSSPLVGSWTVTARPGSGEATIVVAEEGGTYTVALLNESAASVVTVLDVVVTGDTLSFRATVPGNRGRVNEESYDLRVTGDELEGSSVVKVDGTEFMRRVVTGTRKP